MRRILQPYNRLLLLGAWIILLFLIATNIQAGWLYVIISFMIMLGLCSVVMPRLALKNISARIMLPELCEMDTPQTAAIVIENNSGLTKFMIRAELPGDSGIEFDMPFLLAARIRKRGSVHFSAGFTPRKRGDLKIKHIFLTCGNPIGLFTSRIKIDTAAATLVYPRASFRKGEKLAGATAVSDTSDTEKKYAVEDPYFYKLREYTPGDSLRTMHWKLSAKLNELIVRINERRIYSHSGILVDNLRSSYAEGDETIFESQIENAFSLAAHILFERGASVTVSGTAAPSLLIETVDSWEHAQRWFALIKLEDFPRESASRPDMGESGFVFGPDGVHDE
ncbi:MAG TPA: DUF58 domain-containing protein [bacterium]|nr:DUF58 domain-containing protein [bacterium]